MKENNMPPLQSLYTPTTKNDFYNVLTNAWDNNQAFVVYNYDFGVGSENMRIVRENLYSGFNLAGLTHPESSTNLVMIAEISGDTEESVLKVSFDSEEKALSYGKIVDDKKTAEEIAGTVVSELFAGNENGRRKSRGRIRQTRRGRS
jgi:hypothetical protein